MTTSIILVALIVIPIQPVERVGDDLHSATVWGNFYHFDLGAFYPRPDRCAGLQSEKPQCTPTPEVDLRWATTGGENMTFALETQRFADQGIVPVTMYLAGNQSFGGYSFLCGTLQTPECSASLVSVHTNATVTERWSLQWDVVYEYPTTEPLL